MELSNKNNLTESNGSPIGDFDQFFTTVNHNLKTPIHIIKSVDEVIFRESTDENIKEYAATAIRACDMFELVVNRLVLISQFVAGKAKTTSYPFSLMSIIDDFISSCSEECRKKNIKFDFDISPSIPDNVIGDNTLVRQIMYTLVTDLINIFNLDRLIYKADWTYTDSDRGNLYLNISAYATNIYNEIKAEIIFPTEIYKCIIELLDGEGTLSDNGNQVTFSIRLPIQTTGNAKEASESEKKDEELNYIAPSARILVVDDYDVNITVLSMLLKRTEIQIDSATSGEEALKKLEDNSYDIIFIDYLMPEMDGVTLMGHIRDKFPEILTDTSIYVLSANTYANDRQLLKAYGFKGFIPKPLNSSTLDFIIRNNIPEKKLVYLENIDKETISEEKLNEYKNMLKKYDTSLEDALHYLSNDFLDYVNISAVTSKQYSKNTERLNKYLLEEDIESIRILVHSIKSNSKLLGFNTLSQLSALLEAKAAQGDMEYVKNAFPFFMYLRGRSREGVEQFLKQAEIDGFLDNYSSTSDSIDKNNYVQLLDDYIDNLEPEPALRVIKHVISQNLDPCNNDALRKIADYIEELEYESAANLLKEITQ